MIDATNITSKRLIKQLKKLLVEIVKKELMMGDEYPFQAIFERDKFTCQYCGFDASKNFDVWWHANLSIDHLQPKKHGGGNEPENLVLACHTCNLYKGSTPCESIEEAKKIIGEKRAQAERFFKRFVLKVAVNY